MEVEVAVVAVVVAARHLQHQLLPAAGVEGDVDREGRLAAERAVDELGRRRPSHRAVAGRAERGELREGAAAHLWREERRMREAREGASASKCAPCPPRVRAASRAHLGSRVAGETLHRRVPRHHLAVGVGGDARDVHAVDGRRPRRRPAAGARLRRRRARRHRRVVLLRQQLGDGEHADQAALDVVVGVRAEREHLHVAARAEEGHLDAVDHLPLQRLREHAEHARTRRLLDVLHQRAAEDVARRHAGQLGDLRVPLDQRARDVGAQDRQQPRRHPHLVGEAALHPRVRRRHLLEQRRHRRVEHLAVNAGALHVLLEERVQVGHRLRALGANRTSVGANSPSAALRRSHSQSTRLAREERFEVPWRSKPPAARPPTWASQARFGGPAQPRGYPEASYL